MLKELNLCIIFFPKIIKYLDQILNITNKKSPKKNHSCKRPSKDAKSVARPEYHYLFFVLDCKDEPGDCSWFKQAGFCSTKLKEARTSCPKTCGMCLSLSDIIIASKNLKK